jgi:hypothetical protein
VTRAALGPAARVTRAMGLELLYPGVGQGGKVFVRFPTARGPHPMVNLRSHDPFSGHTPTGDAAGDGGNDPIQPITPGEHPPPPVTQPPVEGDQEGTPTDGLDGMLKTDLADLAAAMGLSTSGTKADLVDRIRADRANSPK